MNTSQDDKLYNKNNNTVYNNNSNKIIGHQIRKDDKQ